MSSEELKKPGLHGKVFHAVPRSWQCSQHWAPAPMRRTTERKTMELQAQPWDRAHTQRCVTPLLPSLLFHRCWASSVFITWTISSDLLQLFQVVCRATDRRCSKRRQHRQNWIHLIHILAAPWFTVGACSVLALSEPQFAYLENGDGINAHCLGLLSRWKASCTRST